MELGYQQAKKIQLQAHVPDRGYKKPIEEERQ